MAWRKTSVAPATTLRPANAGTHVWSGTQNGLWSNPANWSSGGAPSALEAPPVIEGQGDLYIYTSYLGEPSFINIADTMKDAAAKVRTMLGRSYAA